MSTDAAAAVPTGDAAEALLAIRDLRTHFGTDEGIVRAVDGVSLLVRPGQTLAIVGESGSGKSVTGLSIMGLIPNPPGRIVGGEILFRQRDGRTVDLVKVARRAMLGLRGKEISMIFQEPMTSLNPVFTIGNQIAESVRLHLHKSRREARAHARRMLELVEIPAAERRLDEFPHQLSGGMRQRAMIALALACTPSLLIADEPTTALDVTIQAQILALLAKLQAELGMSILFVTHNLGVVAQIAHHVAVMYCGRVVESGPVDALFARPLHPYTRGLLRSLPGRALAEASAHRHQPHAEPTIIRRARLLAIPGQVASPLAPPPGCAFAPRCELRLPACEERVPELAEFPQGQRARCIRAGEVT
ncbi:MAG TPA: ABC transporter ATP-binding protein [Polyangia bacterium]|nr:ABC transporter ATP-binding protein [Polyangia bacterium]